MRSERFLLMFPVVVWSSLFFAAVADVYAVSGAFFFFVLVVVGVLVFAVCVVVFITAVSALVFSTRVATVGSRLSRSVACWFLEHRCRRSVSPQMNWRARSCSDGPQDKAFRRRRCCLRCVGAVRAG